MSVSLATRRVSVPLNAEASDFTVPCVRGALRANVILPTGPGKHYATTRDLFGEVLGQPRGQHWASLQSIRAGLIAEHASTL